MFDSIGWGEIVVVALAALFIFGPDRLPTLARDAAEGLRRIRTALIRVRSQVDDTLGPDFPDLRNVDLAGYRPKNLIREHLLRDLDA